MKKQLLTLIVLTIISMNVFAGAGQPPETIYEPDFVNRMKLNFEHERNNMLSEINSLQAQINGLTIENRRLTDRNSALWLENTGLKSSCQERVIETVVDKVIEKEVIPWWGWVVLGIAILI